MLQTLQRLAAHHGLTVLLFLGFLTLGLGGTATVDHALRTRDLRVDMLYSVQVRVRAAADGLSREMESAQLAGRTLALRYDSLGRLGTDVIWGVFDSTLMATPHISGVGIALEPGARGSADALFGPYLGMVGGGCPASSGRFRDT